MNTLMPYEAKWIAKRLKIYRIKYAEIYNEVYDHILSAVTEKRKQGDKRDILSLFQQTMDQDIGSHAGIANMTEERERFLGDHLKSALKTEFLSYFNSARAIIPTSVGVGTYLLAQAVSLDVLWLMAFSMVLTLFPFVYFLFIGTKYGYLRTITNTRKASLVNKLMINRSHTTLVGGYTGFFTTPCIYGLIVGTEAPYSFSKHVIQFMGYPGMSILIAAMMVYVLSFTKVTNTDYRQLIKQVVV